MTHDQWAESIRRALVAGRITEVVKEAPMYGWYWTNGDEYGEPDRDWITIHDPSGEEYATIIHRRVEHPNTDRWKAQKEVAAERLVQLLNADECDNYADERGVL